jgi:hypothetical protein
MSFRTLFFVIPSVSEESIAWMLRFACALFSMTRWCHSERQRGIHSWMLRFAQHDKTDVIPSVSEESSTWMLRFACALFSMTRWCHSERQRGIHSWMLHFIQHDKTEDVIPSACEESSTWMLRFAQHDKLVDASLRSA